MTAILFVFLVGGFQDFPGGTSGAVARFDDAASMLTDFIGPDTTLNGVGTLLVDGDDLYVTAGFAGRLNKYNATTGAVDETFTPATGLAFPASMVLAPDGNGLLVGILGFADGTGHIARFDFDGTHLGEFASAQSDPENGFREATGMVYVGPKAGDFNGNGTFDAGDLDVQAQYIADSNLAGDVNGDGVTDVADRVAWTEQFQNSWLGDSNFDGEFNSSDLIDVLSEGKYETLEQATYAQGDWNGDLWFDSGDFVEALAAGGYEMGPRTAPELVPEPSAQLLLLLGGMLAAMIPRRRGRGRRLSITEFGG